MGTDFVYKNAPLVEVMVEVHWALQPLQVVPGAAVDPHFDIFTSILTDQLAAAGYKVIENIEPPDAPIELLPYKVLKRYRLGPNVWPVFQAGPGVFTVNMVPPYRGWQMFRGIVANGFEFLYGSYPMPTRYLKIQRIDLRYVNVFTSKHGYTDFNSFTQRYLRLNISLPVEVQRFIKSQDSLSARLEIRLPLAIEPHTMGFIMLAPGYRDGSEAAVMELIIRREPTGVHEDASALLSWLDRAHTITREWFGSLTTDTAKQIMGPVSDIDDE